MKIRLAATLIAALVVPSLMLVSGAGAANPHPGTPPGQGGDPNASCGGGSGGKPGSCNSPNLPFSDGCLHGQAPVQNPHCQGQVTPTTPTTPTTPSTPATPGAGTPGAGTSNPQQGVAGATAGKKQAGKSGNSGNVGAAAAVNQANPNKQLPFTGLNAGWLALMGAGLLGTGLALRARSASSA